MNNEDLYFTKDLSEAAAVYAAGAKFLRLQQDSTFFWFVFQNKSLCEQLANQFWSGELQVSAKSYADSMRSLKDRLFARK